MRCSGGYIVSLPAPRRIGLTRRRRRCPDSAVPRRMVRTWARSPRRLPRVGPAVLRRGVRLSWPLRLAGWLAASSAALLLGGWVWLAAGPAALEALLLVVTLRVYPLRAAAGQRPDDPDDPGGAGVREPRRPLPVAGAGSAELPLPA